MNGYEYKWIEKELCEILFFLQEKKCLNIYLAYCNYPGITHIYE